MRGALTAGRDALPGHEGPCLQCRTVCAIATAWVIVFVLPGRIAGCDGHCGDGRPGAAAILVPERWVDPADVGDVGSGSGWSRVGVRGQVRRGPRDRLCRTRRPEVVQPQRSGRLRLLPGG